MQGFLAYILPVGGGEPGHPAHPIAPGGPPPEVWPGPGYPAHPIAPGGQPPYPAHPIAPGGGAPSHPIVIPPDSMGPGVPEHPIYIPSPPVHPSHPIIIPPDAISPGVPSHPIYIPPGIWGGGNEGFPTHPIAPGGAPPGYWGGSAPWPGYATPPIYLPEVPEEVPPDTVALVLVKTPGQPAKYVLINTNNDVKPLPPTTAPKK